MNCKHKMYLTLSVSFFSDTLRVWTLDLPNRKIKPESVNMGQLKRIIKCIEVTTNDDYAYCGTTTGEHYFLIVISEASN